MTNTSDMFHDSAQYCTQHIQRLSAAFGARSAYSSHQKYYHAAKLLGVGGLVLASAFTLNVEGVIGGVFAIGDEVLKVEDVGQVALNSISKPEMP